jgi:hypothetical protein
MDQIDLAPFTLRFLARVQLLRESTQLFRSAPHLPHDTSYLLAIVAREAHTCASPIRLSWALVTERPVALPPVWLEEYSMSKADEYRQFANHCIVWARIATSDDQREQFLELANSV